MEATVISTPTVEQSVAVFREARRRQRTMVRGGGASGRNAGATTRAIVRCQRVADDAMRQIMEAGERRIAGDLTEESSVIDNIAASQTERPELRGRLVILRRDVRRRLEYIRNTR